MPTVPEKTRLIVRLDSVIYERLVAEASQRKAKDDAQRVVLQAANPKPLKQTAWAQTPEGQRVISDLYWKHRWDIDAYNRELAEIYKAYRKSFGRPVGRPPLSGPPARRLYEYVQDLAREYLEAGLASQPEEATVD